MRTAGVDRTDPGARAAARLKTVEQRHRTSRVVGSLLLGGAAAAAPVVSAPVAGGPGATVGGVFFAILLAGCAFAMWPWAWSPEERRHRELEAIWHHATADADGDVPWERYAAWARAQDGQVELMLLRFAGTTDEPSPWSIVRARRVDPEDVGDAAVRMEDLREEAAALEARARTKYLQSRSAANRRAFDDALRRAEAVGEEYQREADAKMRKELAAEEAAERRAQAEAVARALRRR